MKAKNAKLPWHHRTLLQYGSHHDSSAHFHTIPFEDFFCFISSIDEMHAGCLFWALTQCGPVTPYGKIDTCMGQHWHLRRVSRSVWETVSCSIMRYLIDHPCPAYLPLSPKPQIKSSRKTRVYMYLNSLNGLQALRKAQHLLSISFTGTAKIH